MTQLVYIHYNIYFSPCYRALLQSTSPIESYARIVVYIFYANIVVRQQNEGVFNVVANNKFGKCTYCGVTRIMHVHTFSVKSQ